MAIVLLLCIMCISIYTWCVIVCLFICNPNFSNILKNQAMITSGYLRHHICYIHKKNSNWHRNEWRKKKWERNGRCGREWMPLSHNMMKREELNSDFENVVICDLHNIKLDDNIQSSNLPKWDYIYMYVWWWNCKRVELKSVKIKCTYVRTYGRVNGKRCEETVWNEFIWTSI